jgi:hypothetical protein
MQLYSTLHRPEESRMFKTEKVMRLMRTEVGLHISFVSSLVIPGEAMTCSVLHPLRNCEYGLFKECLWFLEAANGVSKWLLWRETMGIFTYLCKMLDSSAIFLKILYTSVPKEPCRTGSFVRTEACIFNLFSKVIVRAQWIRSIREAGALRYYKKKRNGGMPFYVPRILVPSAQTLEPWHTRQPQISRGC